MRRGAVFVIVAVAMLIGVAHAQDDGPEDPVPAVDRLLAAYGSDLTPERVDALVAIADGEVLRAALRERLLAEIAARDAVAARLSGGEGLLAFYGERLRAVGALWPSLPELIDNAFARPGDGLPPIRPERLVFNALLVLATGAAGLLLVGRVLAGARRDLAAREARGGRLGATMVWLLLDACMIGAFFLAALVLYIVIDPPHPLAGDVLSILFADAVWFLLVERVVRLLTSPVSPLGGLTGLSPAAARRVYGATVAAALLLIGVRAGAEILLLMGMAPDAVIAAAIPASAVPFLLLIAVVATSGRSIASGLRAWQGEHYGGAGVRTAVVGFAIAYFAGTWMLGVDAMLHREPGVGLRALVSLVAGVGGLLLALGLRSALLRFYGDDPGAQPSDPALQATTQRSTARLMAAVWLVVAFAVIYLNAVLWRIDLETHIGLGSAVVHLVANVAAVAVLGYILWSLAVNAIDRALSRAAAGLEASRAQRLKTLLPLLRRFIQIVIVTLIGMVVLSSLGVEIGPLLAGAGVVGIAIGLGAQQTIADIIAGVLFLMDDAFRVGEYVEVGNLRGQVEGISLRCLTLRHHRGAVHTLPFGQMKSLTNYTRDWALMRLEFRVAAETDPALVKRLIKAISKELLADPELGPHFIEPLKSQGIRSVEDGAAVFGVKFVAKPGEQFVIRREAYQRILEAFRENGIELVGRGVVVKVDGGDGAQGRIAAAAAQDVLERGGV